MPDPHYINFLYPLQDKVLKITEKCNTGFYLTGGTALSRHYLNHRYSDDLDFFINNDNDFHNQADKIIAELKNSFGESLSINLKEDTYVRLFISEKDLSLKIEFINDVAYHSGEILETSLFSKTDSIQNILSNKISALSRNESKDFADLLFISRSVSFNWEKIISESKQKDTWVNELDISKQLFEFDVEKFTGLKWIEQIDLKICVRQIKKMADDVLMGTDNSIFQR